MTRYALLVTLSGGLILYGQPVVPKKVNCLPPQEQHTLVLSLVAENVAVPGNPGLHWHVSPLPAGEDIQVTDSNLKSAIEDWVRAQNDPKAKRAWVLDGRNPWTFFNSGLSRGLAGKFNINPFPEVPPPSTSSSSIKLPFVFCAAPAPTLKISELEIQVVSAKYDPAKPTAPQLLNAKLDQGVTAAALLADEDTQEGTETVLIAFGKVAATAWQIAKQNGIAVGSAPDDTILRKAETSITAVFDMAKNNIPFQFWRQWPQVRAVFQHTSQGKCCTLSITNVQMAKSAVIRVEANLPDAEATSEAARKSQCPDGVTDCPAQITSTIPAPHVARFERAQRLAQRNQDALMRRFGAELAAFRNTVPTFSQIDSLRSNLSTAHEIYPTVRMGILETDHQVIVFDTDNRWTILTTNLSAGGGYTAEDKGNGKIDFQGENLILQVPDQLYPKETESLSYTGGGEVQKASANWSLNWTHDYASGAQTNYGPTISGDYCQDHNQRFGNLTGPLLRDHEIGWETGFDYAFSSTQVNELGNPASQLFAVSADIGIRQRWVKITPATGNLFPPVASGTMTALFLDLSPGYHYLPAKPAHIGGIDASAAAHFLQGLPAGGFTFTQIQVSIQATVYLGKGNPRDYFVRFRKGMGTSNGTTPLFELFRLGGTDNTRGVEQGEQVGREIGFEQSEAGISARQIVSWFKHEPEASRVEHTPKASPIDLTKIYLKGFYDRGRVTANGSFSELFAFGHAAKGYGAAVELAGLQAGNKRIVLSIGYARSPDSPIHRSGVPITSASLEF